MPERREMRKKGKGGRGEKENEEEGGKRKGDKER